VTLHPNVRAFLELIAWAEGTSRELDPYRVCYGYRHKIVNLSEHPAITGEWRGEKLPDAMCRGAGLKSGCVSTAAGKYQIIKGTWVVARDALGLTDFSAESQDRAAVQRIATRGALRAVEEGRVAMALVLCRKEWASLPGAGYAGQSERTMAGLKDAYLAAGGTIT
jgi:muramidase (phage lysozyme)